MRFLINLPRKILAHSINLLLAIPLTFTGILLRALAEWLNKDLRAPIAKEPINTEYLEAIEYLQAELAKQEEAISRLEDEEFDWDEEGDNEDGEKTIH